MQKGMSDLKRRGKILPLAGRPEQPKCDCKAQDASRTALECKSRDERGCQQERAIQNRNGHLALQVKIHRIQCKNHACCQDSVVAPQIEEVLERKGAVEIRE